MPGGAWPTTIGQYKFVEYMIAKWNIKFVHGLEMASFDLLTKLDQKGVELVFEL